MSNIKPACYKGFINKHAWCKDFGFLNNFNEENFLKISQYNLYSDFDSHGHTFKFLLYQKNLYTEKLGKHLFWFKKIGSTFEFLKTYNKYKENAFDEKFAILAYECLSARGRSGNIWLSPKGSIALTLQLGLSFYNQLIDYNRLACWLQHIAALALTRILCKDTYVGSPLTCFYVKWPNDVMYNKLDKIAGILVSIENIDSSQIKCNISFGLNYLNVGQFISLSQISEILKRPLLEQEIFVAKFFNLLEDYLNPFINHCQNENFDFAKYMEDLKNAYYKFSVFDKGQLLTLASHGNKLGKVLGLDDYGFLLIEVQPNQCLGYIEKLEHLESSQPKEIISIKDAEYSYDVHTQTIKFKNF